MRQTNSRPRINSRWHRDRWDGLQQTALLVQLRLHSTVEIFSFHQHLHVLLLPLLLRISLPLRTFFFCFTFHHFHIQVIFFGQQLNLDSHRTELVERLVQAF
uniref:(northern house mosquito) hypothetical protein n=1 Tax=Culex pipiens TaxID=7175 RepID=A0A8D8IPB8_CULPI